MKSLRVTLLFALLGLSTFAGAADCDREAFLGKLCVSNQSLELGSQEIPQLQCEARTQHTEVYSTLGQAFDRAPVWMQRQLCDLSRIGVYYPAKGTTISWSYFSPKVIGISKLRMDQLYDMSAHAATMMRQAKRNKTVPDGMTFPTNFGYQTTSNPDRAGGVLYLLAHEMGHILYNSENVERRQKYFHACNPLFDSLVCPDFKEGQFGFLDWINGGGDLNTIQRGTIRPAHAELRTFVTADASVIYTPESADRFFRRLNVSNFVSPFSLFSPEEDFCETVTHMVMSQSHADLRFQYLSGESIDVWSRVRDPHVPGLKAKVQFVEEVIERIQ